MKRCVVYSLFMFAAVSLIFGCSGGGGTDSGGGGTGGGGTTLSPDISAPASSDFGVALLGGYSEREIVVKNVSTASTAPELLIDQIYIGSGNPAFSIEADGCSNASIRSSDSCTLKIRLTPSDQIDYNDSLVIPSNDPDENPFTIPLSGKGRKLNVAINEVKTDGCPLVLKLLVSVTDAGGAPLLNLDSSIFSIFENGGNPRSISKLTPPITPISVTLVLDYSGSLLPAARDDLEKAARDFIDRLRNSDEAALIRFNEVICDDIHFITTDSTGKDTLKNAIDAPYQCGELGTVLYDATFRAIENTAALAQNPRRAVIVLSDGNDTSSTHSLVDVTNLAVLESVPLFTVAYLDSTGPKPEIMQQLAQETGGQFFKASTSTDVDAIYKEITTILSNQYLIEYTTSSRSGGTVSVDVEVNNNGDLGEDSKDATGC